MPRRPYRHKKVSPEFLTEIQDIIRGAERDAELVRRRPALLMSQSEFQSYLLAVAKGLVSRLGRISPRQAQAAKDASLQMFYQFGAVARTEGLDAAKETTEHVVSELSSTAATRDWNKALALLIYLGSLALAEETARLPKDEQKRKRWLRDHENMSEEDAASLALEKSDSSFLELILAHRYQKSESFIHKALAQGPKILSSILARHPAKKPR